jgi:outer membrane protein insertion porin family
VRICFFILILMFLARAGASWTVQTQHLPEVIKTPLLKHYPHIEKTKISRSEMDELIHWLHSQLGADRVTFTETSPGVVKLSVQRVSRIGEINITGFSAFSETEIRNFVKFSIGDPYNEPLLMESGERLQEFYHDQGYLNAEIDVEMPANPKGDLVLNIFVDEGPLTKISSISFQTNNEDLKYKLLSASKAEGKGFNDTNLSEIQSNIRRTLNREGYYLAEISGPEKKFNADETKVELSYKLNKLQTYVIEFKGNEALNKSTLEDEVLDMENYSSANPNLLAELSQKLKNAYLEQGFARVEVQGEETDGIKPNTRILTFNIDEGAKIKIDRFEFNGRFSRDEDYYREFIQENSSELIEDNYFNNADLEKGFNNLITHLQNQGHLLAKIVSRRIQYNRSKDRVTIYVNLDEGPVTRVDKIEFSGNQSVPSEELLEVLDLEANEPLKLNIFEEGIQRIKNHYYEKGFIDMVLLNEKVINESEGIVVYNTDNTQAELKFKISEGPRVRVAAIMVEGNYFTKDYVILNEIELPVGSYVTPSKIDESVARLHRLGLFGTVEIRTLEEKTNTADRTLIVRVTEREPGEFIFGFGGTNERGFTVRGYIGGAYRNLWGTGRAISIRAEGNYNVTDIKYLEHRLTMGYLEPYLFNSRYRGRINLTRSKDIVDYDARKGSEVNQATWSVEKNFTSNILGIWDAYSIATVRNFILDGSKEVPDDVTHIASTGPTFDFDYLDNFLNPTKGWYAQLSSEWASPDLGSSEHIRYWRTTTTFKYYKKIAEGPWIWANAWRFGYLENLNDGGYVPYDIKGFILGGRNTLRGYESGTTEVFPNRTDLGLVNDDDDYQLTTRAKMGLVKTEVQFPIYGNIGGSLFYDGGYVEIQGLHFNDYFRDSFGIGIKYNTPVGPLNLEFGWKLDRRPEEEPGRFHLSIGSI